MLNFESQRAAMLSGQVYDDLTRELIEARASAVVLTDKYNKSFGPGAYFEPVFLCEFDFNISVGKRFYANFDCIILDG